MLTENYGALNLLLTGNALKEEKENTQVDELMEDEENIHVIFGSSFPKDQEYMEVVIILNCMHIKLNNSVLYTGKYI